MEPDRHSLFVRQTFSGISVEWNQTDILCLSDRHSLESRLNGTCREVLNVSSSVPTLRAYAHCAPDGGGDTVTLLLLNVAPAVAEITISGFPAGLANGASGVDAMEHVLAGAHDLQGFSAPGGINSTQMKLNGQVLKLHQNGSLPALRSRPIKLMNKACYVGVAQATTCMNR